MLQISSREKVSSGKQIIPISPSQKSPPGAFADKRDSTSPVLRSWPGVASGSLNPNMVLALIFGVYRLPGC